MKDKKPLGELLRETWLNAMGLVSSAEAELSRATSRLAEILGRPKEEAQHLAQELQARVRRNREELDRRVHDAVHTVSEKLSHPLANEVAQLRQRIEQLNARLDEAARRRRERKPDG
jgi:polyhydroxyalkanoate synthesis regulator phasin